MKILYSVLFGLTVLLAAGCQKDPYPYITKQAASKIESSAEPPLTNIAFIYKGNVYYLADFTKPAVQITTDGSATRFIRMSHDHSKFAYMNSANTIVVVDAKGILITKLTQYTQVKSFDWSADDKTLYILNNSTIAYYGPSMSLPAFTYPGGAVQGTQEVISASVSTIGDLAYVTHTFDFFNGDTYELVIIPAGNGKPITYTNPSAMGAMDYVNFSSHQQDMIVGYSAQSLPSDDQGQLDVFSGLKSSPAFSYSGSATPVYNSALNFIVGSFKDAGNNNLTEPAAIYTGPTQTINFQGQNNTHSLFLTGYSISSSNILYTDWK